MSVRTTKKTVSFTRPFMLGAFSEQFPAGRYAIDTDEEMLDGMLFPAYSRNATVMQLISDQRRPGIRESVVTDSLQLDAAMALDAALASMVGSGEASSLIAPGAQPLQAGQAVSLELTGIKP